MVETVLKNRRLEENEMIGSRLEEFVSVDDIKKA